MDASRVQELAIASPWPEPSKEFTFARRVWLGGTPGVDWLHEAVEQEFGEDINVLDVREPHEYEVANIGVRLIPLGELPQRLLELDQDEYFVVHCKTGGRSAKAGKLLQDAGFQNGYNVQGGITAWSDQIDPSVP